MAVGELILTGDTLNQGRIKINDIFSGQGQSNIWSSSTGSYSIIANNYSGNLASGSLSLAGGKNNVASKNYSIALWGSNNLATAKWATINGGKQNHASGYYSFIGGGSGNTASATYSVVVGGTSNASKGFRSFIGNGKNNTVNAIDSLVVGGRSNSALTGNYNVVVGGKQNTVRTAAGDQSASILGGVVNTVTGGRGVVVGGLLNYNKGYGATIINGSSNYIGNSSSWSFIGAGTSNSAITSSHAIIVGGNNNWASGKYSFIGNGNNNSANTNYSVVVGGKKNKTYSAYDAILGGSGNTTFSNFSVIGGGKSNSAITSYTTIGGGYKNISNGKYSFIGGGSGNTSFGAYTFIGGGKSNSVMTSYNYSVVVGGCKNTSNGKGSFVGGGYKNSVYADYSAILGGSYNTVRASDIFSIAIGKNITTNAYYQIRMGNGSPKVKIDFATGAINGTLIGGTPDFAEYFEWETSYTNKENRFGFFVSLKNGKVKKGNENILGITSSLPGFVGDSASEYWSDTFLKDDWGRTIHESFTAYTFNEKSILSGQTIYVDEQNKKYTILKSFSNKKEKEFIGDIDFNNIFKKEVKSIEKINPVYDPAKEYIPRENRPEWIPVGVIGKIKTRTSEEITEETVTADSNGMAVNSSKYPDRPKYQVLKTIRPYQEPYGIVQVFFK